MENTAGPLPIQDVEMNTNHALPIIVQHLLPDPGYTS